jgi:LL-diaminopimelate aminotransferase
MKSSAERLVNMAPLFFASLNEEIATMQAQGGDVIRLDVGSPDLPPSSQIIAKLVEAAALPDRHGYISHNGPRPLREAWAKLYQRSFGVDLDVDTEIVPLMGSKEGIFHLMLALIDPGDIVLVPNPGYPTYTRGTLVAGGEPYFLPLLPERNFLPDLQAIPQDVLRRVRVLWLNYPNNPTAAIAPPEFFAEAVAFASQHDILLCHDAAYTQVTFDGYRAPSILEFQRAKEVAVEFNTLSKSYNMAGWRVGVAVGNAHVLRSLSTLKTHADSSHFLPVLEAATTAMAGDQNWLEARNDVYRQRRDVVVKTLNALGLPAFVPQASLYVWSPIPAGWNAVEFASAILQGAQVSLTPGTVFGERGEGFVRISLTAPVERTAEAMQRIERWMNE